MENKEEIPGIKGIRCKRCQFYLPDIVIHTIGRLDDRDEPSRQYVVKCNRCRTWHRYDEMNKEWVVDDRATMLGTTKVPPELLRKSF